MTGDMLPILSRAQVRELDRIAIEEFGIPSVVLMEYAGRAATDQILQLYREADSGPLHVAILCGAGNNGGDGYVVARHLHEAGWKVTVLETADPERLSPDAAVNRRITQALGLSHLAVLDGAALELVSRTLEPAQILIDALLGTGFQGRLREPSAGILRAAQDAIGAWNSSVIALDVPSGFDVDSGQAAPETLRAEHTLTFGADKLAYQDPESSAWTGEVSVLPIGAPQAVYDRIQ
ncbi:MAG: hydroxyethylthiazole kinase-like uncharacterized protein yjeF [Planctomycetota bacterium]|jgi:hydroxyethylthiazole kinase-like uncharacterized protein yjeF